MIDDELKVLAEEIQNTKFCKYCHLEVNIFNPEKGYGKLTVNHKFNNPEAIKILLVGIAPSYRRLGNVHLNDKELRAFEGVDKNLTMENVKTSGDFFDRVLVQAKYDKCDVYIDNILKCSIPFNVDADPEETKKNLPYLKRAIEIINPSIIIALGSFAHKNLLEMELKQKILKIEHPSFVWRNKKIWDDYVARLKTIKNRLSSSLLSY